MNMIIRTQNQASRPAARAPQSEASAGSYAVAPETGGGFSSADSFLPDPGKLMRDLLQESIGYYIITQHLVGTAELVVKQGLLVRVEQNAFVLQDGYESFVVCDYYSLKFFRRLPAAQMPHDDDWSPTAAAASAATQN